ncbi:hypothetical protein [Deinococcus soli (ex Cha et al. 2016)]|uniref:Uncharacterized protein n=2 Tax=Deinococcus soli (ex Cha et al. 2016) TaxID=1309411 RepID=A0AAE4BMY0_9DEIO|nr:hypothetical protein [Deinococcus soli (ex Cha et al. 2016)]MDR6218151.1 hypothetical protein [Deinococcus soli (ex Cha et al. 2016)]MDR6328891.1 hypothetical protein [Deinococcus soli (ex Cha et al. 2016)]MDR6751621.1 hypothetical protein [Deinococcus soli (ex Cha et al. 2016)]
MTTLAQEIERQLRALTHYTPDPPGQVRTLCAHLKLPLPLSRADWATLRDHCAPQAELLRHLHTLTDDHVSAAPLHAWTREWRARADDCDARAPHASPLDAAALTERAATLRHVCDQLTTVPGLRER